MQLQLTRSVKVRCIRVLATLAFPKDRPVESALLRWMDESLQAGREISAESVCAEGTGLLPGRSQVLGLRLLAIADDLRLVERSRGRITGLSEIGRKAQQEQKIYVPERCTWSLYFSTDPLLNHPLLHFAPYQEISAHEELRGGQKRKDASAERDFMDLPSELAALKEQTLELPSADKPLVRIDDFEPKCEKAEESTLRAQVEVGSDQVFTSSVKGAVDNARIDHQREWPRLPFWDVFLYLLEQQRLKPLWQADAKALRQTFREVEAQPAVLRSFERDVVLRQPSLGKLGAFGDTVIRQVPVVPASPEDAQSWHDWLLTDGINDYHFSEQYRAHSEQVAKRFVSFSPRAVSQEALAARIRAARSAAEQPPPVRYWQLRAPIDLELEGAR